MPESVPRAAVLPLAAGALAHIGPAPPGCPWCADICPPASPARGTPVMSP